MIFGRRGEREFTSLSLHIFLGRENSLGCVRVKSPTQMA